MENNKPESFDWSFKEASEAANLRQEQMMAVFEAEVITHLEKFGRQPEMGIPILDAFIDVGCPCRQCFRDEFIS
jgi:hypothetical protein